MKMNRLLFAALLIVIFNTNAWSQSTAWKDISYHNERELGMALKFLRLSNPADANQIPTNYLFPEFDLVTMRFEKGAWSRSYRNKLAGDFIGSAFDLIFNGSLTFYEYKENATTIHNFIGWWNITKNIYLSDFLAIAVGGHLGDYYLAYELDRPENYINPKGFHVALGPAIMIDYRVMGDYIIHFESATAYGQLLADGDGFGAYPAPIILNNSLEFRTNYRLYAGIEHVTFINRTDTPFRGNRFEFKLGLRWSRK